VAEPVPTTWCLVVPVKRLDVAKSRLTGHANAHRADLALAFAADTVSAALLAPTVVGLVAVTDDAAAGALLAALGATVVADEPDAGLNPALVHGARVAAVAHPGAGVGALSADLPALRAPDLADALAVAARHGSAVVADAGGEGTTAYLAACAAEFSPAFGPGSLLAHVARGAHRVGGGLESLRRDVDTPTDLAEAVRLGVGPHTAAVLARMAAEAARIDAGVDGRAPHGTASGGG
jgi:2-phospho-L-lactate guanylyltransferase